MTLNDGATFCSNCGEPVGVANEFNNTTGNQFFNDNNINNNVSGMNNDVNSLNNYGNNSYYNNAMNNASVNNNYVDNMNNGMNNTYINQPNTMSSDYNNVANVNDYSNGNINIQNGNQNNNSKKIVILIAIILVVIVGVGAIIFLTKDKDSKPGSVNPKDYDTYEDYAKAEKARKEKHEKELNKNFSYKVHELANGELLLEIVNNNNEAINVDGLIKFFDSEGSVINDDLILGFVDKKNKLYYMLFNYDEYARYELEVVASETMYVSDTADVEIVSIQKNDDSRCIDVKFKNKSKDKITVSPILLFYDSNDVIIGADSDHITLEDGNVYKIPFLQPFDKEFEDLPYSRYELFYSAYHYDLDD